MPSKVSIYQDDEPPKEFCDLVRRLESELKATVWLLVQNHPKEDGFHQITRKVYKGFQRVSNQIEQDKPAVLLIESPGGYPNEAYRLTRLFQRRASKFTVLVPQYAKSAATLMALGADELVLGRDAELGPLDLQVFDEREERYDSALNAVQSLERLSAYSLTVTDQMMQLLMRRLPKRSDELLPFALGYVADLMKPLMDKVDTVDYARKSRDLKVTEEYAARLMRKAYGFARGKEIARRLVENYPAHGFVVDTDEAICDRSDSDDPLDDYGLGLKARTAESELQSILDEMTPHLDEITVAGRIEDLP